jgi:hypothetical protein
VEAPPEIDVEAAVVVGIEDPLPHPTNTHASTTATSTTRPDTRASCLIAYHYGEYRSAVMAFRGPRRPRVRGEFERLL